MGKKVGERSSTAGLGPRICEGCGAEFQPYRANQLNCSRKCRDNGAKATATRHAYLARPEVKERTAARRRIATADDVDAIRALNLKNTLRKYGVTPEWYADKSAEQDGACILCGHVPPAGAIKAASRLHVDHDHTSGAVRDLLCTRCNQGLGFFRDNPALLRAAADYIERHRGTTDA